MDLRKSSIPRASRCFPISILGIRHGSLGPSFEERGLRKNGGGWRGDGKIVDVNNNDANKVGGLTNRKEIPGGASKRTEVVQYTRKDLIAAAAALLERVRCLVEL